MFQWWIRELNYPSQPQHFMLTFFFHVQTHKAYEKTKKTNNTPNQHLLLVTNVLLLPRIMWNLLRWASRMNLLCLSSQGLKYFISFELLLNRDHIHSLKKSLWFLFMIFINLKHRWIISFVSFQSKWLPKKEIWMKQVACYEAIVCSWSNETIRTGSQWLHGNRKWITMNATG